MKTYKNMVQRSISMKKEGLGANVLIVGHRCYRCKHAWVPRDIGEIPEICPKCKSPYWKKEKTRFTKLDKKGGKKK
jgi:predicted Zn-ribbon and HTH transcriptional regulator